MSSATDITDLMKISISSDTSNVIADLIHYDWVGPQVNNGSITGHSILMLSSISLFNAGQMYTCTANDSISTAVNQSKMMKSSS